MLRDLATIVKFYHVCVGNLTDLLLNEGVFICRDADD